MRPLLPVLLPAALALASCSGGAPGRAAGDPPPAAPAASPPPAPAPRADCPAGKGKLYEVGPDAKLRALGDVPWEDLGPGDTVRIHWRADPYREKILLSGQGTAEEPIRVCGVRGPEGQLPVVSGKDATSRRASKYPYVPTQERGLIIVTVKKGMRWGEKPKHILIQDLDLQGAHPGDDAAPVSFVDSEGETRRYNRNAAAVFVERGEHVTVRGCTLSDSAYGLFVASGGSEEVTSREILVEGNHIFGNGIVGVDRRHNVYSEAAGIVFQWNRFGPQRKGALGNQLKDRSAGTVIRYNWIEGGAHLLDLVEPEEAIGILGQDPRYHQTFVYGNVLVAGPDDGTNLVHYGGDNGILPTYRKGTLYFFHNTVVVSGEESKRWHTTLLHLETAEETADVRNNVIHKTGSTHLTLMRKTGVVRLGVNWVSEGFEQLKYPDGDATFEGLDQVVAGKGSPFADVAALDVRPAQGSPLLAGGGPLAADLPAAHALTLQYSLHQQAAERKTSGKGATLGAFE